MHMKALDKWLTFMHRLFTGRWCTMLAKRKLGVFVAAILLTPIVVLSIVERPDLSSERALVSQVSELRERLSAALAQDLHKKEQITVLAQKFDAVLPAWNSSVTEHLSADARLLLYNVSSPGALRLPSIYSYLPHLLRDPRSTTPAFVLSKGRSNASIVLGVPTVQRTSQSYLMTTLHTLIDCMTEPERQASLIVVLVAESDMDYVERIASLVQDNLKEHVKSGLVEVVSPPASYYPDFSTLRPTLGDPLERVRWRTKQNLDFAFLMMYSQNKGLFYLQLEDDVQTKPGYISTIKSFALQKTAENRDWFVLDFCQLGFIGKLFRSRQLSPFVSFLMIFNEDKPGDWLLDLYVTNKVCRSDKPAKDCKKAKEKVWIHYKPSLFQHIGTYSSLKGKVQKLKDKQFGKVKLFVAHHNPPARITTSIKPYKSYTLEKAYRGETFFWGLLPQKGDELSFVFHQPTVISEFLFRSGNVEHPSDRFYKTSVEILPASTPVKSVPYEQGHAPGYLRVGSFDDMGVAEGQILAEVGAIKEFKLCVQHESDNWAILSEIHLKTPQAR